MKKLVLLFAFAGLVGTVSASVSGNPGDDKKDKAKKEAAAKKDGEAKACCKKDGDAKACSGEKKEGKSCCKAKAAPTPSTSTTEQKK